MPVAYRRLPKDGGGNKCNIAISKDVFSFIREVGDCVVTVVDIKSYFESLDHDRIKSVWETLIDSELPPDHLAVFNSITKYSIVDLDKLFKRLKLNDLVSAPSGNRSQRRMRNIDVLKADGYKQICSTKEFREIVAGSKNGFPSLIQKNGFNFGIPQGTPISDLVANFYLIDFDQEVNAWVSAKGGMYKRYSDDIVIVIPKVSNKNEIDAKEFLQSSIKKYGRQLRIQDRKVCVVRFDKVGTSLDFTHISGSASRNGLEYLGFEYNGKTVKIKNSTLSNAWRKINRRAHGHASRFVKRYRAKGQMWMVSNYQSLALETKMLRDVTYNQDVGFDTWTFIKYVRRASRSFVGFNPIFSRQTKRYRRYTKLIIAEAFNQALKTHA
nr:reverse transcriptase domain-containing protein [Neorhizobium tomejilense]